MAEDNVRGRSRSRRRMASASINTPLTPTITQEWPSLDVQDMLSFCLLQFLATNVQNWEPMIMLGYIADVMDNLLMVLNMIDMYQILTENCNAFVDMQQALTTLRHRLADLGSHYQNHINCEPSTIPVLHIRLCRRMPEFHTL
jgi:hypothetical protein